MTYDEIKRLHGIKDADFAAAFSLSEMAFRNSSALQRYKKAVEDLFYIFIYRCR